MIKAQCARYRKHGKPWHRSRLQNLDDYDIVRTYGAEYRGVVNYYLLAQDVSRLTRLRWNALTSMLKTLAAKHHSTVTKMAARYKAKIETSDGLRTCFEARKHREGKQDLVARFGGIILRQNRRAVITRPRARPGPLPPQGADPDGSANGSASSARPAPRWQSTRSPASKTSGNRDRASPRGPPSWRKCGARRSSSARRATTGSTRTPSRTRHKSLESPVRESVHAGFGGRLPGKGPGSSSMNTGPRRAAHPTPTGSGRAAAAMTRSGDPQRGKGPMAKRLWALDADLAAAFDRHRP